MRFIPLQTALARRLCDECSMPADLSTGILIEQQPQQSSDNSKHKNGTVDHPFSLVAYRDSAAILRILPHLGFPFNLLGRVGLAVPMWIRDAAYKLFAKNRGTIWKNVKRISGLDDYQMDKYRDRILGLPEDDSTPLDPGWGFGGGEATRKKTD